VGTGLGAGRLAGEWAVRGQVDRCEVGLHRGGWSAGGGRDGPNRERLVEVWALGFGGCSVRHLALPGSRPRVAEGHLKAARRRQSGRCVPGRHPVRPDVTSY
jgi:hypothetical protein